MLLSLEHLIAKYQLRIQGVIHVGGHFGQEVPTYLAQGFQPILIFEPVPSSFAVLQQNVGSQALLMNTALGNHTGTVEMFIETDNEGQSNSILSPALHLLQYPHIGFIGKIRVPITRLDVLLPPDHPYNLLNIDVQGYELEVLKGAARTLQTIDYIYTEVNRDYVYANCALVEELDAFLLPYGFERVETSWQGGSWGDALYLKSNSQMTGPEHAP